MANMSSLLGTEEDPNDFLASVLAAGKSAPPMSSEALTPLQMVMYPQDTTPMNELIPNLIKSKQGVTVTSAPRAMISRDDNEELNQRTTPALDRQKTSLEALKDQIDAYAKKDTSVNPLVAAVMGASDIFGRTNYVKDQLMPMKQAEAQREMNVLGLKKDYQKQVSDLTKEDLAFKRQQYQDAQNQSRESRILNLEQQKLDLLRGKTDKADWTPAEISADRAFGKTYQDYVAEGGFAEVDGHLKAITEARDALKNNPDLVGGSSSLLPDVVRKRVASEGFANEQKVKQAIQSTLRTALGPAFTAKEGQDLLDRAYDPALSAEQNIEKLDATLTKIEAKKNAMQDSIDYYEKNRTLKHYSAADRGKKPAAASEGPAIGTIKNGYKFIGGKPSEKSSWEKQ